MSSLFIGNLSTRTRRDVLELAIQRIFRKFGTCTVRLKERYGFVDYDYPASAEKALKTLQGTKICGEPMYLSWSKQKRTVPQSFVGGKPYEPPRQNFYSVKQYPDLKVDTTNRQEYETAPKKLCSSILVNESNCYDPNIHDRRYHPEEKRWGEQVVDPTYGKYPENIVFERYEPNERRRVSPVVRSREIKPSPSRRLRSREREKEPSISRKRQKRDYESRDINHLEVANKGPSPSSVHSDNTLPSSQSRSRALRSFSRSPSLSKSKSDFSKKISLSSSPLPSKSQPSHSGTKTSSSRSTSRSKSPNSSLLPVEQDSMDNVDNAVSVDPSKNLFEEETLAKSGAGTFKPENIALAVETEIEKKPADLEPEDTKKESSENGHIIDDVGPQSVEETKDSEKEVFVEERVSGSKSDVSMKSNASKSTKISSDNVDNAVSVDPSKNLFEEERLAKSGAGTFKPENIAPAVETEIETKPADLEPEDTKKESSENGHIIDDVGPQSVEETKDSEKEVFVEEHVSGSKSDVSIKSNASKSTKISSEEMFVVLKHYGLQLPDEHEKYLPVETYFGSARLWPWEMVYYRRLKKGSISSGNYSRRVAQNQEFGIVDKFIRSSSGWGEI